MDPGKFGPKARGSCYLLCRRQIEPPARRTLKRRTKSNTIAGVQKTYHPRGISSGSDLVNKVMHAAHSPWQLWMVQPQVESYPPPPPPPPIPFPIVLAALISRRYLELLVQQVRSPSHPISSLAVLVGLHLITYHQSHLRSLNHRYGPLPLLRF